MARIQRIHAALGVALVALCSFRFNRNDFLIGRLTGSGKWDDVHYENIVRYFRGEAVALEPPWTYRPAVPFLASWLPFRPDTSLNLLNVVGCVLALFILFAILRRIGFSERLRWIGGALFVFSFPVLYYSTIGYVDAVLVCFLMAGTYLILTDRLAALVALVFAGVFVKESVLILLPVMIARLVARRVSAGTIARWLLTFVLAFATATWIARSLAPTVATELWLPSLVKMKFNLLRPRTYLSIGLAFGLPGLGSMLAVRALRSRSLRLDRSVHLPLLGGLAASILLTVTAFIVANADGKFIWTSYPFSIPLSLYVVKTWLSNGDDKELS